MRCRRCTLRQQKAKIKHKIRKSQKIPDFPKSTNSPHLALGLTLPHRSCPTLLTARPGPDCWHQKTGPTREPRTTKSKAKKKQTYPPKHTPLYTFRQKKSRCLPRPTAISPASAAPHYPQSALGVLIIDSVCPPKTTCFFPLDSHTWRSSAGWQRRLPRRRSKTLTFLPFSMPP